MNKFYFVSGMTLLAVLAEAVLAYSIDDESTLQTDLLAGYNINVRPSDQVDIQCSLNLINLLSLNIVDQTLTVTGSLAVIWDDDRLSWNESQTGIASRLYFRSDEIWRPTLVLQNSVTGIEVIGDNGNQKSIPISVTSDGVVFWLAPAYFSSYCSVDISTFPFDTQTCELVISGWMLTRNNIKLNHQILNILLDRFEENGEYDIIRSYTRVDVYRLYRSAVEHLIFGIELRRKYSYYLINVVLPVFFMQLLGLVVFVVPTESGEKLTFSLTLLLSLTVMMTLVAEKIPTTSLQIPTLKVFSYFTSGMYMLGGTVISSLELIMTVVILHFKQCGINGTMMTRQIQTLATVLASLTCNRKNIIKSKKEVTLCDQNTYTVDDKTHGEIHDETTLESTILGNTDLGNNFSYTYEDIYQMLDKASLFLFSFITFVFTFTMLLMIL